jgi:hypothetical protein
MDQNRHHYQVHWQANGNRTCVPLPIPSDQNVDISCASILEDVYHKAAYVEAYEASHTCYHFDVLYMTQPLFLFSPPVQ